MQSNVSSLFYADDCVAIAHPDGTSSYFTRTHHMIYHVEAQSDETVQSDNSVSPRPPFSSTSFLATQFKNSDGVISRSHSTIQFLLTAACAMYAASSHSSGHGNIKTQAFNDMAFNEIMITNGDGTEKLSRRSFSFQFEDHDGGCVVPPCHCSLGSAARFLIC